MPPKIQQQPESEHIRTLLALHTRQIELTQEIRALQQERARLSQRIADMEAETKRQHCVPALAIDTSNAIHRACLLLARGKLSLPAISRATDVPLTLLRRIKRGDVHEDVAALCGYVPKPRFGSPEWLAERGVFGPPKPSH